MEERELFLRIRSHMLTDSKEFLNGWDQQKAFAKFDKEKKYIDGIQLVLFMAVNNPMLDLNILFKTDIQELGEAASHIGVLYSKDGTILMARSMYDPEGFGEPGEDFKGQTEIYKNGDVVKTVFFGGAIDEDQEEIDRTIAEVRENLGKAANIMSAIVAAWGSDPDTEIDNLLSSGWGMVMYSGDDNLEFSKDLEMWAKSIGAKIPSEPYIGYEPTPKELVDAVKKLAERFSNIRELWNTAGEASEAVEELLTKDYPKDFPDFNDLAMSVGDWAELVTENEKNGKAKNTITFPRVRNLQDVKTFFKWCEDKIGGGFHPDTPFADYVDANGNELFTSFDAERYDIMMDETRDVFDTEEEMYECLESVTGTLAAINGTAKKYPIGSRFMNNTNKMIVEVSETDGIDDYGVQVVGKPKDIKNFSWVSEKDIDTYLKSGVYSAMDPKGEDEDMDPSIASRFETHNGGGEEHTEWSFQYNGFTVEVERNIFQKNTKHRKYFTFETKNGDDLVATGDVTAEYDIPSDDWEVSDVEFDGDESEKRKMLRNDDESDFLQAFQESIDVYNA